MANRFDLSDATGEFTPGVAADLAKRPPGADRTAWGLQSLVPKLISRLAKMVSAEFDRYDERFKSATSIEQDPHDQRRFVIRSVRPDGTETTSEARIDAAIYCGVFDVSKTYRRGDMVTFGGSVWHANRENDEKPIGSGDAWTLAVRRGKDGRDGIDRIAT